MTIGSICNSWSAPEEIPLVSNTRIDLNTAVLEAGSGSTINAPTDVFRLYQWSIAIDGLTEQMRHYKALKAIVQTQ